ncbi:hypothetical protein GCM10009602_32480 [Nocardiopsis tropica]
MVEMSASVIVTGRLQRGRAARRVSAVYEPHLVGTHVSWGRARCFHVLGLRGTARAAGPLPVSGREGPAPARRTLPGRYAKEG